MPSIQTYQLPGLIAAGGGALSGRSAADAACPQAMMDAIAMMALEARYMTAPVKIPGGKLAPVRLENSAGSAGSG